MKRFITYRSYINQFISYPMGIFTKQPNEMTVAEAANITGYSETAIRQAIYAGSLKATKRGRSWFIKDVDFEAWANSKTKRN